MIFPAVALVATEVLQSEAIALVFAAPEVSSMA